MSVGKKPLDITRDGLEAAIEAALPDARNPSHLWKLVAESEWAKSIKEDGLSTATVMNRAKAFGLEVVVTKSSKIDKQELQAAIYKVEAEHAPTTHTQLWTLVTAELGLETSPQNVRNAAIKHGVEIKTPKGKKGGDSFGDKRGVAKGTKRASKALTPDQMDDIMSRIPDRVLNQDWMVRLLEKVEKGSLTAMVKLGCLQCSGFQRKHIADCSVLGCVFRSKRPYQGVKISVDEEVEDTNLVQIGG